MLSPHRLLLIRILASPSSALALMVMLLAAALATGSAQAQTYTGLMNPCGGLSDCAYQLLNQRVAANQTDYWIYMDADSGFNRGYPSGLFGQLTAVSIDTGCLDDPADTVTGCFPATDTTDFDKSRGTVFRVTFSPLTGNQFAGLNIEEPQNWGRLQTGVGYDMTGATELSFDVRSPDGLNVQFGIGGCVTNFFSLLASQTYVTLNIPLNSLTNPNNGLPCTPDLSNVHILFTVTTNAAFAPNGGTVLIDNLRVMPVPSHHLADLKASSFPLGTQTFGVVHQQNKPIPFDQVNRNVTTIYEAALAIVSLLGRGQPADVTNALEIANTLHYVLFHDNHGVPIPVAPGNPQGCYGGTLAAQCGLHNAYISGDVAFLNDQSPPALAKAGDARLAGFSASNSLCGATGYCLVLDGATGGNNAWAMRGLLAAYQQSGNTAYLQDAIAIGNWIVANLYDSSGAGYGGYFVGYNDGGLPKQLILGKSTENNGDIFASFTLLAEIELKLGNASIAAQWSAAANIAGDFVMRMFESVNGRFYAGTVNVSDINDPCADSFLQKGNDLINKCDYLDADTFTILPMAAAARYAGQIDWTRPLQYVLGNFTQSVTAGGILFQGFGLVNPTPPGTGIAWEFTSQAWETCTYLNALLGVTTFQECAQTYGAQVLTAQTSAPFGDGLGLVASTLQNGDTIPVADQCLPTTFQCIPERVGVAATVWAILAQQQIDPLAFAPLTVSKAGSGTVTSGDGFINCGTACSYLYNSGTQVTLTATPAQGWRLGGWTGCDSTQGNTCTVTMVNTRTITATFIAEYTLSVADTGTGTGSVTSSDGNINCGAMCSHIYDGGTVVTLTATSSQDSSFTDWSGCDSVQGNVCTVTMSSARAVNAIFSLIVPNPLRFIAVTPCRTVDTRPQHGGKGPIQGGTSQSFVIPGTCDIPTTAAAYSLNITVVPHGSLGYLTVWPTGLAQPLVSTLNSVDGRVKADAAIVPAGASGAISIFANMATTASTDVIVDINGYFVPASDTNALVFYPMTPCRVVDTRKGTGPLGGPDLTANQTRDFPLLSSTNCSIPSAAQAYSVNFTVVPTKALGYLTAWPADQAQPVVSTLNDTTGTIVANAAIVPAAQTKGNGYGIGDIKLFVTDATAVIIDINGYFAPEDTGGLSLYTVAPCRVLDTRKTTGAFNGTLVPPVNVVASPCGVANTAQGFVLNATVVPPGSLGYLTLWPDGQAQPLVSTLNAIDGFITNNMAIVPTLNGSIDAFASGTTQLILDLFGYFAP